MPRRDMLTVADTAFSIAAVRAEEAERPERERLFEDPYAHLFRSAGVHALEGTNRYLALPFFRDGIRLRTRVIDDFVRDALATPSPRRRQLVNLGAGFDTRGMRMPEIAAQGVTVFEIDSPDQLARKHAVLTHAGVEVPSFVRAVPFDFDGGDVERDLPAELARHGFERGAGAIFLWEGVIGYISLDAIDRSLRFMAGEGGAGTRLALTSGRGLFDPDTIDARLNRAGFSRASEIGMDEAWTRYLPRSGPPPESASFSTVVFAAIDEPPQPLDPVAR